MTQEEKESLIKDLSARLPYGVKMHCSEDIIMTLRQIDEDCFCECWENEDFKCHSRWMLPYLRPMSSMTEDEANEFETISEGLFTNVAPEQIWGEVIDWLNAHHFDYRGLIPMNLALEAPKEMYKIN